MPKCYRSMPGHAVLLAALLLLVGGCATSVGRWTRADYELNVEQLPTESGMEPLSSRIYLIADNQRHELLGDGVRIFRTSVADELTQVAIRPPQLDLFGQDLLREALTMADGFVLHLGDACDISNTGEFARFAWDMRRASQGWVMAPGNHDGYFFGNSSRILKPLVREWDESAETYVFDGATIDSRAMQKDRYVSYYLAALVLQDAVWSAPLARSLGAEIEERFLRWRDRAADPAGEPSFAAYWTELEALQDRIYDLEQPDGDGAYHTFELSTEPGISGQPHLRRLAWRIAKKLTWRSFVLQEVDISAPAAGGGVPRDGSSILVLDTANYTLQPSLEAGAVSSVAAKVTRGYFDKQVAGKTGSVSESQEEVALGFARSMKQKGRRWMLASHHPYRDLARRAKPRFDRLRDAGGIPITLSAHSHFGEILWNRDDEHEGEWLEINVGSILDAPVEFRDLQILRMGDRLAVSSRRHRMEERLRERGLLADEVVAYRPVPGDEDFFMNYENRGLPGASGDDWSAAKADYKVKHLLLAAYRRMFDLFEADAPDQSGTYWPTGPDGSRLHSHEEVTAAVRAMLADSLLEEVETLTQFLYELREFDRTRMFSSERGEKLRAYRLSQAIWAGQAEYRTWTVEPRGINPEPSLLVLPRPASPF